MSKQTNKIKNSKLKIDGSSNDGKRLYIGADTNDGWEDIRIEVDTDDVDSKYATAFAKRIVACVNKLRGQDI